MTTVVLIGVSGSGKSTIAVELRRLTGWPFAEADSFHSASSVAKMRSGKPLDDADRWPWLAALAGWIGGREEAGESAIVACSALRRVYRDRLREGHPSVTFVALEVPTIRLADRVERRPEHYMPATLLASQLDTFEPLAEDEPGFSIAATGPAAEVAEAILRTLVPGTP